MRGCAPLSANFEGLRATISAIDAETLEAGGGRFRAGIVNVVNADIRSAADLEPILFAQSAKERSRFADIGMQVFPPEQQTPEALRAHQKA